MKIEQFKPLYSLINEFMEAVNICSNSVSLKPGLFRSKTTNDSADDVLRHPGIRFNLDGEIIST